MEQSSRGENRRYRRSHLQPDGRPAEKHAPRKDTPPMPPPKQLLPAFSDADILRSIVIPRLSEGDAKMEQHRRGAEAGVPAPRLYRPNVGVHFFNEFGQVFACFRKDGKSWQTVQGGIEEFDGVMDSAADASSVPLPMHSSCDPRLMTAAIREVAEEIGFRDLASVGCEFVALISPPNRTEMEDIMLRQQRLGSSTRSADHTLRLSPLDTQQLDLLEADPMRFFRYEFKGQMGMKARQKGYVGQEQYQLVFFLPSSSIGKVNLVPDRSFCGPDVVMEFKAVAWMSPNQFVPLCADFKQSMISYVLTCKEYTSAVSGFLSTRGGIQSLGAAERNSVTFVSPHVPGRQTYVMRCSLRARSPSVGDAGSAVVSRL